MAVVLRRCCTLHVSHVGTPALNTIRLLKHSSGVVVVTDHGNDGVANGGDVGCFSIVDGC
ncbi:hypothetical protein HanRHA438_Chr14g0677331 [Helianthus annuus]|uniref:Uncharacterized protein n=1 Tax=Helianthus annuus TaxID=4232 RepID=A0A251SLX1_HELAN|nr:hypothetical protein HanXRQr2_Chr14g0665991 [Helianthus annuus]KAJ0470809.1 hypothetical protein HanIR_Chr14g0722761 [Helianthus annuus]KAJ0842215.1 hypothetical protein HanPSC8_Chr14g0639101 [Helianthus annuus]KAJ0855806.1 hypothetical protein HanRHA438_Chr14g0677331 [Helianthus annuus]